MKEKIKQEAAHAMRLVGLLNVNGDAVDVVAAVRQSLRNITMICDAAEEPEQGENAPETGDTESKAQESILKSPPVTAKDAPRVLLKDGEVK